MISAETKTKGATPIARSMPSSQSSSESDQKRERIEIYKDLRRRELSSKYGPRQDTVAKSFKATRKKNVGGNGTCGPFLRSYLNSQYPDNQVPLSDSRRYLPRRDGNKTDSASENNEDRGADAPGKESVVVRETKASRLRAATRTSASDPGSPTLKPSRDSRSLEKEKCFSSGTPTCISPSIKDVDKSHSRKSHLNRSHTSEGVYANAFSGGSSNIRRRGTRNLSLEATPTKSNPEKNRATMGNTNGNLKEPYHNNNSPTKNISSRSSLSFLKKSPTPQEKSLPSKLSAGEKFSSRNRVDDKKPDLDSGNSGRIIKDPLRKDRVSGSNFSQKSSDKSKNIDIAARAEILAASTLKMINRLDEINSKTKKAEQDASRSFLERSPKKPLPFSSVISSENTKNNFSVGSSGAQKPEIRKLYNRDENTAKNSSSPSRNVRVKPEVKPGNSKTEISRKLLKNESFELKLKGDTGGKQSILKNKPSFSSGSAADLKSKPVSILKRKSLSQDEAQSSSPPVTFSPSVLIKEDDAKKQGILKKRRSFDENEVMRRRSYSPDANYSDFKSILKNQRRSSLEELRRRSRSPDSTPQGILKRKSSKEEDNEDVLASGYAEPQGILKRKSLPCLNLHQHVKISDSVILSAAVGMGNVQISENVRPILKKKSSSEEHSASDLSITEVPKSILKKKTSLDMEEMEEMPKKPILKSSRVPSFEESEDLKGNKSLVFNAVDVEPKPILKKESSRSKISDESSGLLLRVKPRQQNRPSSSSDIDSELSAIFLKRRSLEFQPLSTINFDWESQKPKKASSNDRLKGDLWKRPSSVAEKVSNLENFLEVERLERERRNSHPGSPPNLKFSSCGSSPLKFSPPDSPGAREPAFDEEISGILRKSSNSLNLIKDQPASMSLPALGLSHDENCELPEEKTFADEDTVGETSSFVSVSPPCSSSLQSWNNVGDLEFNLPYQVKSESNLKVKNYSPESVNCSQKAKVTDQLFSRNSLHSTDSEKFLPWQSACEASRDEKINLPVDSCGEKISSLSLKERGQAGSSYLMSAKDEEDSFLLSKSGSVSAKTSFFKEMEKKVSLEAGEEKLRKTPKGGNSHRRFGKNLLESNSQRYHTQPVSSEEVEKAVRKNRDAAEANGPEKDETYEDELSALSYKDRLRLFESTFSPQAPESRKRSARFRTQPVTSTEVQSAKNQRPSLLLPTLSKSDLSDLPKNESSVENISESVSVEVISPSESPLLRCSIKNKPKGILKNLNQSDEIKSDPPKSNSDSHSSECENKGDSFAKKALKKSEKESNILKLKGILKQPSSGKKSTSSSEEDSSNEKVSKSKILVLGANLAAILQNVEPVAVEESRRKANGIFTENPDLERITRQIHKLRNSSIAKSQSHSAVSSVFRPGPETDVDSRTKKTWESSCLKNGEKEEEDVGQDNVDKSGLMSRGIRRSTTQPLDPSDESADDMSGASIQERLARLKRSGELDWQKRKSHVTNVEDELSVITAGNYLFNKNALSASKNMQSLPQDNFSRENSEPKNSSSILADRLGKLDAAKDGWKKRIKPSDAVRFSVEGKMMEKMDSLSPPNTSFQISPTRTPLAERKKRSPRACRFRSKQPEPSWSSTPSSPIDNNGITNPISRSVSAPGGGKNGLFGTSSVPDSHIVTVPKNDDETFTAFFGELNAEKMVQERFEINDEDLDMVSQMKSSQILVQKRNIKTQRRRAAVGNPVKALAERLDFQEYREVKNVTTDKELRRAKIEKAAKVSNLAIEALAGLASHEDFTAINLKKPSEGNISSPDAPYKELMLLQVKGRRHVQTRLVEPSAKNVNAGDCFILVTSNKVFHYVGEFANVIEKSRGAEISAHIQQKGDLGCNASSVITIGEGGKATEEQKREFWKLLGGYSSSEKEAGNLDEDELFETALIDTNMIYEVVDNELVPNEKFWGSIPKIEVLDPNKVLVFDFGSEFYVWNGKNVNLAKRKIALKLAKELWEEGFDYSECDICPLTFASHAGGWEGIAGSEKAGRARPEWALFAKITQNMETVLFREKFLDWPDYSRVIRRTKKAGGIDHEDPNANLELKPCDGKSMVENLVPEPDLLLEGNHLGRGIRYFDEETRRCSEITTQDVTVWHVREYEYSEISPGSVGQFHMEDSYVVRWHYIITITGRELSGQPSKHLTTGRNRYAYFFWQGRDSPLNDKGAAACLTVELDKEHGPQVRVVQGSEPPAFLNLFHGKMVVHSGRRFSEGQRSTWRLFISRGSAESESVLFEVPCSMRQLRSVASLVLVNRKKGQIIVWHGWKSLEHTKKIALIAAEEIQNQKPEDFEFETDEISIKEEVEGSESGDFIKALGGDNRQLYFSLLDDRTFKVVTPRLFHLTSVSGEFLFSEVASPYFSTSSTTPFPFVQSDLYFASQPALFLLDTGNRLWLWQGWWEDSSESDRGSGYLRFQIERRAAMSTALSYWTSKHGDVPPKAYLVWAGLEPLIFTNHFPLWNDRDDVAEINMKDGKKPGEAVAIKTELASLTQSTYSLAQLQNRPLPDGVNPTSLEDYLEPQCFLELFGVDKEEFSKMPSWKKKKLKQDAGLF